MVNTIGDKKQPQTSVSLNSQFSMMVEKLFDVFSWEHGGMGIS